MALFESLSEGYTHTRMQLHMHRFLHAQRMQKYMHTTTCTFCVVFLTMVKVVLVQRFDEYVQMQHCEWAHIMDS